MVKICPFRFFKKIKNLLVNKEKMGKRHQPKQFIKESLDQVAASGLSGRILVLAVLLVSGTKPYFYTFERVSQQVRESPEFQDRRIYQGDLVITKFQDEVYTSGIPSLYFAANGSRGAFSVLNSQNTNGFYPRNQSAGAEGREEDCVLDSLEVDKGIIGVFNCDLSVEFYQFSSGLISLDYYGRIPYKDYGFSVGNCSSLFINTPTPNLSFLACEDASKTNLHLFEILGTSFAKIAEIKAMNLSVLAGVYLHEENHQKTLIVARKIIKNSKRAIIYASEYPPKNSKKLSQSQNHSISFDEKRINFGQFILNNNTKTNSTSNSSANYIYMDNKIHLLLATMAAKTKVRLKEKTLTVVTISSPTNPDHPLQLTAYLPFKAYCFSQYSPESCLDIKPITVAQNRDPEGIFKQRFAISDYKSKSWMLCEVKNQTSTDGCKTDMYFIRVPEIGSKEILRMQFAWQKGFVFVNKNLDKNNFFCSFKKFHNYPEFVLTDIDGCLMARSSQFVYLNQSKLYRREGFGWIESTSFLVNSSRLAGMSLPGVTFKDYRFGRLRKELSFVPDAHIVGNRFEGLEVEVLSRRIAVREMSFFLGLEMIGEDLIAPLYTVRGNPSEVVVSGLNSSLASSISLYQGEEFDLIKQLGVDPQHESLRKVNQTFFAVNNKTNQLKIWASCSLAFGLKNRSVQCLKKSELNLGYKFKVLSSQTNSAISTPPGSGEGWFHFYGLMEVSEKNMTCLIDLSFTISQNRPSEDLLRTGCVPGFYKHTSFSVIKPATRHFLLLCQDEICGVYYREFAEGIYNSQKIGTISSQDQEIRSGFEVEFVKEIRSRSGSDESEEIEVASQFIIKSKTSILEREKPLRSPESQNQPKKKAEQMVNFYQVWIVGSDEKAKVRIGEWHLLHPDFDLRGLEDPFHFLSPVKDRLYQAVYFPEKCLRVYWYHDSFSKRGSLTLYDRRVKDFGIKIVTNTFRLNEELIAVVGKSDQIGPKESSQNRTLLVVLAMFKQLRSYHETGSRTNLDMLRFRQEFEPGIKVNNVFGLGSSLPRQKKVLEGYFVIETYNQTAGKTRYVLNHTIDTTPFLVEKVNDSKDSTNLTLNFQVSSGLGQSEKEKNQPAIMKSINLEIFISKTSYDFELRLKEKTDLPVLKLGSNPLSQIIPYTGQPISFELVSLIDKTTRESPRLIKKYTLARQPYQSWIKVKRHENRMIVKSQKNIKYGLRGRERGKMASNIRRLLENEGRTGEKTGSLKGALGVANCSFYLYTGDQRIDEIAYDGNNGIISDAYLYKQENLTIFTFFETTAKIGKNESIGFKVQIFIHIYDEKMNLTKKIIRQGVLDFKPLQIETFKPSFAQY